MAHHKRGRRKNARAGCLLCKMHKANGCRGGKYNRRRLEHRALISEKEQIQELTGPRSWL